VIKIYPLQNNEISQIASLHSRYLQGSVLSKFGVSFLESLYLGINQAPGCCIFVAKDKNIKKIAGFIAGSSNVNKMFFWVIRKHFLTLVFNVGLRILHPHVFLSLVNLSLYPVKSFFQTKKAKIINEANCKAELLTIAVHSDFRGQKLGRKLVLQLESFYNLSAVFSYSVFTDKDDELSNQFYRSMGFELIGENVHLKKIINEYLKILK